MNRTYLEQKLLYTLTHIHSGRKKYTVHHTKVVAGLQRTFLFPDARKDDVNMHPCNLYHSLTRRDTVTHGTRLLAHVINEHRDQFQRQGYESLHSPT